MKPIIRWSLWDKKTAIIAWSVGIGAYIALNVLVYSALRNQAQAFSKLLDGLSPTAKALFSGSGSSDLLSPAGYLTSKLYYLILPLMFSILAIGLASSLLAREEETGTLELLLSRPVSRGRLFLAKLTSSLLITLVIGTVALVITLICTHAINYGIADHRIIEATALTLLLSLLFGAVAWLLVGLGGVGKRAATGGAAAIALGSYLVSSLESIASWLRWPAKVLPYHYFQPSAVLDGSYNWHNAAGLLLATVILWGLAYLGFRRRDLS